MAEKVERIKRVKKGSFKSVAEMVRNLADAPFAETVVERIRQKGVIDHLMAQRAAQCLSQKDIAERMNCTQSKVSKLEAATDDDLRCCDLEAYATALGLDVSVHFSKKGTTLADRVKFHILAARKLLLRIAELSSKDETMAKGANQFFADVLLNAGGSVAEAVMKNLEAARKNGFLKALPVERPPVVQMDDEVDEPEPCCDRSAPSENEVLVG
jgi:transcriptional regulator with XRE-family HTH domain